MQFNNIILYLRNHFIKQMRSRRGTWAAIAVATISATGTYLGSKNKKKGGSINVEDYYPSWTKTSAGALAPWVKEFLPQFRPGEAYTGKLTADKTPEEAGSLKLLNEYINAPNTGALYGASEKQVMDTLGGKFADPNQSPFIKSMMNLSKMNLQDAITTERGQRGARGTYYTDAGVAAEGRLQERSMANLDAIIGQFVQRERDKQFQAVPLANQMDEYKSTLAPLKKITSAQTLGSLQRIIDQSELEAAYQEFKRQRGEKALPLGAAQALISPGYAGTGGTLNAPQIDKSAQTGQDMSQIMQIIGPLLQSFLSKDPGVRTIY